MELYNKNFTSNLQNIVRRNFENLKAIELVKNNYQLYLDQYDSDLHPYIRNLNETLLSWLVDDDVDLEEFESLLGYTFHKKPKIVQYIRSVVSKENVRLIDLIQIISESKELEKNSMNKSKVDKLLAHLISPPEKSDTVWAMDYL